MERPGCDWPNAPSCACLGHRTSTRIDSHGSMERKATLAGVLVEVNTRTTSGPRKTGRRRRRRAVRRRIALYKHGAAWCRARCEAYYESPHIYIWRTTCAERRQDLEAHVDTMYGLMREYDQGRVTRSSPEA